MSKLEVRTINRAQLRAKPDSPGASGYAAVFNQIADVGWFKEVIRPGAFSRAITEKQDVRCLQNHDPNVVLGRTKSGTLALKEDDEGLNFDCDFPQTQAAKDLHASMQRGDVDQCSFGFVVRKQQWIEEKLDDGSYTETREILDVDLLDVSVVTYPAYDGTSCEARSLWPNGLPDEVAEHRAKKTKRVDDEDLTSDCFLIVGDPEKTDTWALPWKFSTKAKTKSHLRDALARFDQVEGVSDGVKAKAWKKLLRLCKQYGIQVSEDKSAGVAGREYRDLVVKKENNENEELAECLEYEASIAHQIKQDVEEIMHAIAGAVEDPKAAIQSIGDELKEIAKLCADGIEEAQEWAPEEPGDGAVTSDEDRARLTMRAELMLRQ
jgi:HK97 family phage prohead protease